MNFLVGGYHYRIRRRRWGLGWVVERYDRVAEQLGMTPWRPIDDNDAFDLVTALRRQATQEED